MSKLVNRSGSNDEISIGINQQEAAHTPEFRLEALELAERIDVAAAARELSMYESQLYT